MSHQPAVMPDRVSLLSDTTFLHHCVYETKSAVSKQESQISPNISDEVVPIVEIVLMLYKVATMWYSKSQDQLILSS